MDELIAAINPTWFLTFWVTAWIIVAMIKWGKTSWDLPYFALCLYIFPAIVFGHASALLFMKYLGVQ